MAIIAKSFFTSVKNCNRCSSDHDEVWFTMLTNPPDDWKYWGTCPTLGEPIFLKVADVPPMVVRAIDSDEDAE